MRRRQLLCAKVLCLPRQVTVTKGHRAEGAFINRSLLTLGTVIGKLSEGGHAHIPFRCAFPRVPPEGQHQNNQVITLNNVNNEEV